MIFNHVVAQWREKACFFMSKQVLNSPTSQPNLTLTCIYATNIYMEMLKNFTLKNEQLNAFCQKWQIIEFALFGSVLRDDFKPESDVDIIITFAPKSKKNLFDLMHVQDELQQLLNRNVDVFTKKSVQDCHN